MTIHPIILFFDELDTSQYESQLKNSRVPMIIVKTVSKAPSKNMNHFVIDVFLDSEKEAPALIQACRIAFPQSIKVLDELYKRLKSQKSVSFDNHIFTIILTASQSTPLSICSTRVKFFIFWK